MPATPATKAVKAGKAARPAAKATTAKKATKTTTATKTSKTVNVLDDDCPKGAHCYAGVPSTCNMCTVKGICVADENPNPQLYSTYLYATCYPM